MEREIDYVIAVAECGSISQAAELLFISQPSLSRYLSNLERELGTALFVRTINGTELTQAGRIYVEYAKEIKLLQSTMQSKLKELQRCACGKIRIGMTLNSATLLAFNVAEKVEERYPGQQVEIFNMMSKDTEEALKEKQYDFVIGPNVKTSQELIYESLYVDPYILVVPDRYDIRTYAVYEEGCLFPVADLKELPPMDFVLQDAATFVRKSIDRMLNRLKMELTPKMLVTSSILAMQAAENGLGCCIVALGHLPYLNHPERLQFYQLREQEPSGAGVVSLPDKKFSQAERYCINCILQASKAGEKKLLNRLEEAGKLRV